MLGARRVQVEPKTAIEVDPVVQRAWDAGEPIAVQRLDRAVDPALASLLKGARRLMIAPMIADGRPIGAIVLERRYGHQPGVEDRLGRVAAQVASTTAINLRNAVLLRRVRDLDERDPLTGAANRRTFQASLQRAVWGGGRRGTRTSSVLFIDLDDFKAVNDAHGLAVGDALLVAVARRIESLIRDGDVFARLDGDEFAILTHDVRRPASVARDGRTARARAQGAVRARRRHRHHLREHRDRRRRRRRERRRSRPQRRRRDVHGQGRWQGRRRGLRPRHADRDPRAARAGDRAPAGRGPGPARAALPADHEPRDEHDGRRRGAGPLAPPGARPRRARPVHRDRRGAGLDPADRALGAARGLSPGRPVGRRRRHRPRDVRRRERVGARGPGGRASSTACAWRWPTTASVPAPS